MFFMRRGILIRDFNKLFYTFMDFLLMCIRPWPLTRYSMFLSLLSERLKKVGGGLRGPQGPSLTKFL